MTAPVRQTTGRLVNKADFQRLLGTRPAMRSVHFAVHHVPASATGPSMRPAEQGRVKLSTGPAPTFPVPVDDLPSATWLGCLMPKRSARRAVTRNLLKRQVRACFQRHQPMLPKGIWLVRLREAYPVAAFPSARSEALRRAVSEELDQLFARAARLKS